MKIISHQINEVKIAEVTSDKQIISSTEDGLDLLGTIYYEGFDKTIIHKENITPDFFELKNCMAGEILQKFSNYRVRLVIIGDFSTYTSKSLNDFIRESNKGKQVNFLNSQSEALEALAN